MDLFSLDKKAFKIDKNKQIKIFEAFAGYGSQSLALKILKLNIKIIGFSEVDKSAIRAYRELHGKDTINFGDICKVNGSDIENANNKKQLDILTYSFPCTDLSKAGKQMGLKNTRSGLVFQIIRILKEMEQKPKVLLLENVPDLLSPKFKEGWHIIYNEIENLGYDNYVATLNAKDFGVAQNRNRVFMVSVPKGYSYSFPPKILLVKKLKDYLEENVAEKYYLIDEQIKQIKNWNTYQKPLERVKSIEDDYIQTITAKSNTTMSSGMVLIKEKTILDIKSSKGYCAKPNREIAPTMYAQAHYGIAINSKVSEKSILKIRKLTPREAFRLMDVHEKDIDKILNVVSDTQAYKLAGNSIVVNVLVQIFKELL